MSSDTAHLDCDQACKTPTIDAFPSVSKATGAPESWNPTVTVLQDSAVAASNSSMAPENLSLMLIRTLACDLSDLLGSFPEPDVYRTLNEIFAVWHKGKRRYDNMRDGLKKIYKDTRASSEALGACLEEMNKEADCVTER